MKAEHITKLYDIGRECSMTHEEALAHVKMLSDNPDHFLDNLDALYATAYIAIREYQKPGDARGLATRYVDTFKGLAELD